MVAERKRVDGLVSTPAHSKVSHSRPTATGGNEVCTQDYSSEGMTLMQEIIFGLRRPTGNVGQPANGNLQYLSCQCEIG